MITSEKLKIFEKYCGDPDSFTRAKRKKQELLSEDEFFKISRLVSDLKLIGNGAAAESYKERVFIQIDQIVDCTKTKEYLFKLAKHID